MVLCVLHNFLYLSHKVAMATHTTYWEGEETGQDRTGEDSNSHLTGQSSSHLSVFEGETFERVVLRPLAL